MQKSSEIGFFKRILLKLITKAQVWTVKRDDWYRTYVSLCKLHFELYFGKDLHEEILRDISSPEVRAFLHRHACMVTTNCSLGLVDERMMYLLARQVFIDNVMLDTRIDEL